MKQQKTIFRALTLIVLAVMIMPLTACGWAAINELKNTQIKYANEEIGKTYGEVLDGYCTNTKWETFSSGYVPIVEFTGTTPNGEKVVIQWLRGEYEICMAWELDGKAQDILIGFKNWLVDAAKST